MEVLRPGVGMLVCCGEPMELQEEKNADTGAEKHVPIIEKKEKSVRVLVGSVPHPMEVGHYIEWVELMVDGKSYTTFLKPGDKPKAEFNITGTDIKARIYCNLHGLWTSV